MQARGQGDERFAVVPINRTRSGVDARTIFRETLPAGRLAESLWCENDHRLLISETIPAGDVAMVARHAFDAHTPLQIDDSLELCICGVVTCEWARAWIASERSDTIAVAGL
jgi:hypothetical protein